MKHEMSEARVSGQQYISRMCFVCGTENHFGLHTRFMELDDGRLCAEFTAHEQHQGYPGRIHGGIISAILDEAIGRAIQMEQPDIFAVTIELNVRFRKPAPLNTPLRVITEITLDKGRIFEGEGALILEDGTIAANATARYMKLDVKQISDTGLSSVEWFPDEREQPSSITI